MTFWYNAKNQSKLFYDRIRDRQKDLFQPTIRLGVTGLSGAGKTIFITALVHRLLKGHDLFFFSPYQEGIIQDIKIDQQPDHLLPRFEYEKHNHALLQGKWPDSTRHISQIRIRFYYRSRSTLKRMLSQNTLSLDILDYPGEWLVDLPLLPLSFEEFSQKAILQAKHPLHFRYAKEWFTLMEGLKYDQHFSEARLSQVSQAYYTYLKTIRADPKLGYALPPGRFHMAGDFEGAPAFTFFPFEADDNHKKVVKHYYAALAERFRIYKKFFVFPFFREHIARLDRQIILFDIMQSLNQGSDAVAELQRQFHQILSVFHIGQPSWLKRFFYHHIDRILIAATKADQLHHSQHNQLEKLVKQFLNQPSFSWQNKPNQKQKTALKTLALCSIRATEEANYKAGDKNLAMIVGVPQKGEILDGKSFDGTEKVAIFPGYLAETLEEALQQQNSGNLHFIRFCPPPLKEDQAWPHIRLDRALDFLLKDKLL